MTEYRSRYEIVYQILTAASEGARKAELGREAQLNYLYLNRYLKQLSKKGLVKIRISSSGIFYFPTEKGERFIHIYEKMGLNTIRAELM